MTREMMTAMSQAAHPDSDVLLARRVAEQAGAELLRMRAEFGPVTPWRRHKLMDAGDALAQRIIAAELARAVPADSVLSEEAPDSPSRLHASRVWIVDPLDGTHEFGEGRPDFAVQIALWERAAGVGLPGGEGRLTAAAVAVPARGETWTTADPQTRGPLPTDRPLRLVVSRSRPPAGLCDFIARASAAIVAAGLNPFGLIAVNVGSVGAKVGELLAGRVEAFRGPDGLYEWDLAAPYACAITQGYVNCQEPALFNQMPPRNGPVLLTHPELADIMRAAL